MLMKYSFLIHVILKNIIRWSKRKPGIEPIDRRYFSADLNGSSGFCVCASKISKYKHRLAKPKSIAPFRASGQPKSKK